MEICLYLIYLVLGGSLLFMIVVCAVKSAVKEALRDFKEEIIKEITKINRWGYK